MNPLLFAPGNGAVQGGKAGGRRRCAHVSKEDEALAMRQLRRHQTLRKALDRGSLACNMSNFAQLACVVCGAGGPRDRFEDVGGSDASGHAQALTVTGAVLHSIETSHCVFVRLAEPQELFCSKCADFVYSDSFDALKQAERGATEHETKARRVATSRENSVARPASHWTYAGIHNMGNTCFLSAALQCLFALPSLQLFFQNCKHKLLNCSKKLIKQLSTDGSCTGCLACEVKQLYSELIRSSEDGSASAERHDRVKAPKALIPSNLLFSMWNFADYMAGYEQQDSHECLITLLNGLAKHLEVNHGLPETVTATSVPGTMRGIVHETFAGLLRSELVCQTCGNRSERFEPFFDISLPISKEETDEDAGGRQGITLQQCFEAFTHVEQLPDPMTCDACKERVPKQKKLSIAQIPNVLVVHLKRFDHLRGRKLTTRVDFPLVGLDLSPYVHPPGVGTGSSSATDSEHGKHGLAPSPSPSSLSASLSSASNTTSDESASETREGSPIEAPPSPTSVTLQKRAADQIAVADESYHYDLQALIMHIGGSNMNRGHYISFVRGLSDAPNANQRSPESRTKRRRQNSVTSRFADDFDSKQWYKCDDDSVEPVDVEDVQRAEGYIFVYVNRQRHAALLEHGKL